MADKKKTRRDRSREPNPVTPATELGSTAERDFGTTDRYTNQDQEKDFTFRNMGDETAWDTGREASITDGPRGDTETRSADAENPGVKTRPADEER